MPIDINTGADIDLFEITQRINERLGLSASLPGGEVNAPDGTFWDCQFGSLPFLYAFSDENPLIRETAQFRRERIDTATNPGEQSLDSGYWNRSQESWHYGAGLRTAEPLEIEAQEVRFRYKESGGVNPWTAGELTLLNDTELIHDAGGDPFSLLGTDAGVLLFDATRGVELIDKGGDTIWENDDVIPVSLTSDGDSFYAGTVDGIVYKGDLATGAGAVENTFANPGRVLIRWVKGRLVASNGVEGWEGAGSAWEQIDPGTTFPDDWEWTDAAEGPQAIYMSGYSGTQSAIYKITVTVDAGTNSVKLSPLTLVAEMPRGEIVNTLYTYVGSFVALGTSKGVRVSAINDGGDLVIGPLNREVNGGCSDFVALGSYLYAAVGDDANAGDPNKRVKKAGLVRFNLGQNLEGDPLLFAHADDLVADAPGRCTSVTVIDDDRLVLGVERGGVFKQDTTFVSDGWLETGRIRLGTSEPKTWRDLRLVTKEDEGGYVVAHANRGGDEVDPALWDQVVQVDGENPDLTGKVSSQPNEPTSGIWLGIHLVASQDKTETPVLRSYQLRAIPSPARTRLIQVPLQLFNSEQDRSGSVVGYTGYAFDRLQLIEALEANYAVVPFIDWTSGERLNTYIERVRFQRTAPPKHGGIDAGANYGGILTVTLRVI